MKVRDLAYQLLMMLGCMKTRTNRNFNSFQFYNDREDEGHRRADFQRDGDQRYKQRFKNQMNDINNAPSNLSLLHNAYYNYFLNLVAFFWNCRLFKRPGKLSKNLKLLMNMDPSQLFLALKKLMMLRDFLTENNTSTKKKSERNSKNSAGSNHLEREQRTTRVDPKIFDFMTLVFKQVNQNQEYPKLINEEISDEELNSIFSFTTLVDRCIQVIELYLIFQDYNKFLTPLDENDVSQLCTLSFSDLVLNELAADFVNKILHYVVGRLSNDEGHSLEKQLVQTCSIFYLEIDRSLSLASRRYEPNYSG